MTIMGEWFIQQLCGAALSHDLTIPLFILLPHKVQHKTLAASEGIKCAATVSAELLFFFYKEFNQAALVLLHPWDL